MKNPYKLIALLIFAGVVIYLAWPKHTEKDHNPITGEGDPGSAHNHDHLEPAPLPNPDNSLVE
ncbi:MAG: hypothetical protein ABJQ29_00250 [Luteolibacter sp.]